MDISVEELSINDCKAEFVPILRSGAWSDIGSRSAMEDVLVCADNFVHDYGLRNDNPVSSAFYGVIFFFCNSYVSNIHICTLLLTFFFNFVRLC